MHLLSGEDEAPQMPAPTDTGPVPAIAAARIENIERTLESLREEIDALKAEFAEFKKQFD